MAHYTLTVPVTYTDNGQEKTRFQRVGVLFQNTRDNGEEIYNIKLDFPVGATELVAFPPKPRDEDPDHEG